MREKKMETGNNGETLVAYRSGYEAVGSLRISRCERDANDRPVARRPPSTTGVVHLFFLFFSFFFLSLPPTAAVADETPISVSTFRWSCRLRTESNTVRPRTATGEVKSSCDSSISEVMERVLRQCPELRTGRTLLKRNRRTWRPRFDRFLRHMWKFEQPWIAYRRNLDAPKESPPCITLFRTEKQLFHHSLRET